ncbi:MAG TPA: hypothetical protein PKV96_00005, partial [Candidatus Saccharimonas sp.]|nr:hypothetical protein [Candidatus Saccharimonas sp.]
TKKSRLPLVGGRFFFAEFYLEESSPIAVRYGPATCSDGAIYPSIPGGITKKVAHPWMGYFVVGFLKKTELQRVREAQ